MISKLQTFYYFVSVFIKPISIIKLLTWLTLAGLVAGITIGLNYQAVSEERFYFTSS